MKLRNKKTGEIVIFGEGVVDLRKIGCNNVSEMIEAGWEDYRESKGNWTIDPINEDCIDDGRYTTPDELERYEELGLKFNTKEEAELAVRKLKAWKRLKDKGFRFSGWTIDDGLRISICTNIDEDDIYDEDKRRIKPDLDLLFGEEE